jgi:hypothetical protein
MTDKYNEIKVRDRGDCHIGCALTRERSEGSFAN